MTAWVLMTAMPLTTGHRDLVRFAAGLTNDTRILLVTQPSEPMVRERAAAVHALCQELSTRKRIVRMIHLCSEMEQDPQTPGYWDEWNDRLRNVGVRPGIDMIVASEPYGAMLAEITNTTFFPYDIARELNPAKATAVRDDPLGHWGEIDPCFQPHLRTTVTVFGAESTGKSTFAADLAECMGGDTLFEYARPLLELDPVCDREAMLRIRKGQRALQVAADERCRSPYLIRDTDLLSTLGYWRLPQHPELRPEPSKLAGECRVSAPDLYIFCPANIPFEADPIRYGGDQREGSDEFWLGVMNEFCEAEGVPSLVLDSGDRHRRVMQAAPVVLALAVEKSRRISHDRGGF